MTEKRLPNYRPTDFLTIKYSWLTKLFLFNFNPDKTLTRRYYNVFTLFFYSDCLFSQLSVVVKKCFPLLHRKPFLLALLTSLLSIP